MPKIILKHSNGVNKEPLASDLVQGEIAVNTVTGEMYQKTNDGTGDVISKTQFRNIYNITATPIFTIPLSANEGITVPITISNYDVQNDYNVRVTGGVVDTSSHPFQWTLPGITTLTKDYACIISAQAPGKYISEVSNYHYITVNNVNNIIDDAVVFDSVNIDAADFETLTNSTVVGSVVNATDDDVVIETIDSVQETQDSDWTSYKTQVQVHHNNLIYGNNSTVNDITIHDNTNLTSGDIIYVQKENSTDIIETQIGNVSNISALYDIKKATVNEKWGIFLDADGILHTSGAFPGTVDGTANVKDISFSYYTGFGFMIDNNDKLFCIGTNNNGQLGLGDTTDRSVWTDTGINASKVTCGGDYALIIKTDGSVWSTGYNNYGQLGLGDTTQRPSFTDTGISASEVICGYYHTLIIKTDGSVWSTGYNSNGQLGLGDTTDRTSFTATSTSASKVACGYYNTLIIKTDGSIWSTGQNSNGQLGLGDISNRNSFTDTGISASEVICGSYHTLIIKTDGSVWSAGRNNNGQLGLGDTNDRTSFTDTGILGDNNLSRSNDCGSNSSAIINAGQVYTFGQNSSNDGLNIGTTSNATLPTLTLLSQKTIKTLTNFTPPLGDDIFTSMDITQVQPTIALGKDYSMMIDDTGKLFARGANSGGQLGLGDTTDRSVWTDTGIAGVKTVACGYFHTLIIKTDGSVWSAGYNAYGQLGLGDTTQRNSFTDTGISASKVACGDSHTLIIKTDGSVWSTGYNSNGQLGLNNTLNTNSFIKIPIIGNAIMVACGSYHTLIIKTDGSVWSTGYNISGQLGLGDTTERTSFTDTGVSASKVACGGGHTLIIKTDGSVWSTGYNIYGQLGLGDTTQRNSFADTGISASKVACGYYHTLIIKTDGSVWSAGYNSQGQLGLGDTSNRNSFTDTGKTAKYCISNTNSGSGIILHIDNTYEVTGDNTSNVLTSANGSQLSFVHADGEDGTNIPFSVLQTPEEIITQTTPSNSTKPEYVYKKTLITSTSLSATTTPNFIVDTIENITSITNGLLYEYTAITSEQGRYLRTRFEGLLQNEKIINIRTDLEKI